MSSDNCSFKKLYCQSNPNESHSDLLFKMADSYRKIIFHEDELIQNRTNWFLVSTGFLFVAFGTCLKILSDTPGTPNEVACFFALWIVPIAGIAFSTFCGVKLSFAYIALTKLENQWLEFVAEYLNEFVLNEEEKIKLNFPNPKTEEELGRLKEIRELVYNKGLFPPTIGLTSWHTIFGAKPRLFTLADTNCAKFFNIAPQIILQIVMALIWIRLLFWGIN